MFVEDLTPFFAADAPGVLPATIDGVEGVLVHFHDEYALGDVGQIGMATSQPAIELPTAQVPASPYGKAVTVNAVDYTIAEHRPDGTGISVLLLEAA